MSARKLLWPAAAVYVAVGFLTFGHAWHAGEARPRPASVYYVAELQVGIPAVFSGVLWPIYWTALGALEVTKP